MRHLALALLVPLAVSCRPSPRVSLGIHYPPFPEGFGSKSGILVTGVGDSAEFGIDLVASRSGEDLWFGSLVRRNERGEAEWVLVDTLSLPQQPPGYSLILGGCRVDGKSDPALVAVAKDEDRDSLRILLSAWRGDSESGKLHEISTKGIACENEGYGA